MPPPALWTVPREMASGNQVIMDAVERLNDINRSLNMAMKEITGGIEEIAKSAVNITELSETNKHNIEAVQQDAAYYKL